MQWVAGATRLRSIRRLCWRLPRSTRFSSRSWTDADRVATLLQGAVIPALDGGEAEADRIARDGVTPLAPGKRFDLGAQLAFGRRRRQQLSDHGEAQMRPPLM